jgi:hypothetical protein
MTIENQLREKSQRASDETWSRYVALLQLNSAEPAVIEELHDVMARLGKSPADVQHDAGTLTKSRSLLSSIEAARGIKTRFERSKAVVPAFKEDMEMRARQDAAKLDEMEREQARLSAELDTATASVEQLNKTKAEHPELLRHIKPATFADLD